MFFQIKHMSYAGRALILLKKNKPFSSKVERYFANAVIQGLRQDSILFTNAASIPGSNATASSTNETSQDGAKSLDKSLKMSLLKKNLNGGGLGLKLAKNREYLVMDFFNLSKSVMENELSVEDFVATETFKNLQEQIEYNIDIMNNAQIVSLLASVIRMKINPSTNLVKLLEHEVKFRLKLFNLNQIIKMFRFYNSTEMSSEQKQIAEMLSYRIRGYIQNEATNVSELNSVLQLIATQQIPSSLLGLTEERLLNLLTKSVSDDDDDIVSRFIQTTKVYNHNSLCNLFIRLAENKRRPTPLLKAASIQLCKEKNLNCDATLIISTLNALNTLSYPNRALISKLVVDLIEVINPKELDSNTLCNLLRTIGNLRWKSNELLDLLFDHVENHRLDFKKVDHNLVVTLLHIAALLNYQHKNIKQFYDNCMKESREDMLDKQSRKWLNYVWSLVLLNINSEAHIRSVLNPIYYTQNSDTSSKLTYSDTLKLINLTALCRYELKLESNEFIGLTLNRPATLKSQVMQKFAMKIKEAINSIVEDHQNYFRYDVETPFGFDIDCEVHLDEQLEFLPIGNISFKEIIDSNSDPRTYNLDRRRCAIILTSFEDIVASSQGDEVVGHKLMISRILKSVGYSTAFLSDSMINREKTSADLTEKIKTIIRNSVTSSNNLKK